ncbi:MAG: molybdopterin molybdotransferase MoeA [Anaerolineales bacterium]
MLLSVTEAREKLLRAFAPLPTETIPLAQAVRRVLAEAVLAPSDLPPFANSSMDGFAVRAGDVRAARAQNPVELAVVADIPAGKPSPLTLQPGQAARIMTGAPLPTGADAVIPVEDTDFNQRDAGSLPPVQVAILRAVSAGAYVRPQGEDLRAGEVVFPAGKVLRPKDIGMLAMLGKATVPVVRRPRVGVLSTGDELLPIGAPPEPGKIYESNAHTLAALIDDAGAVALNLGIAPDQTEAVQTRLDEAVAQQVDVILSSAGVSVGAYDFVRHVVEKFGRLDFWRVNMRPGKPLAFGEYRGIPYIGLPGNPVSAYVGFEVFVRPALYRLLGMAWEREVLRAVLEEEIQSDGRESYLRGIVTLREGVRYARLTGHQGSGNHYSLVQANAFILVPGAVKSLPPGSEVDILPF